MDEIAAQSVNAIKALAKASKDIAAQLHSGAHVEYLVVTIERASGFVYTPVSNLPVDLLHALDPRYARDLVGSIREQYLFPLAERGPVRDLCDDIRKSPELLPTRTLLLLPIRRDGTVGDPTVFDTTGHEDIATANMIKSHLGSRPLFTGPWLQQLDALRMKANRSGTELRDILFLLRPEAPFDEACGRRTSQLDLMQTGLAVTIGGAMSSEDARICAQACLASSVGALSLLHEKERYYERAARQATTGLLVKQGNAREIYAQYTFLRDLRDSGAINIPIPLATKSDPDLQVAGNAAQLEELKGRFDSPLSWYVMPWIQLPKLSQTILFGSDFKRYELGALMRAAVAHLRQDYWEGKSASHKSEEASVVLWGSLLLAQKAIKDFTTEAAMVVERVRDEASMPVQHSQGISVHDPAKVRQCKEALEAMAAKDGFRMQLRWRSTECWRKHIERPDVWLMRVGAAINHIRTGQPTRRLDALWVHGDAHFLNILADSSVPEDPLIISIDPKSLDDLSAGSYRKDFLDQCEDSHVTRKLWLKVEEQIKTFPNDPTYDVSKYLMSTSCFYDLARNGFSLTYKKASGHSFLINGKPREVNKPLSGTGGISTASLIRLGAGIPDRSLWNHLTCADAVVREYVQLFSAELDCEERQRGINVGLISLWLLTIRSLFSAARILLRGDLAEGSIVFFVTAAYIEDTAPSILEAVRDGYLEKPISQSVLQDVVRWRSLEKIA